MSTAYIVGFTESSIEEISLTIVHANNAEHALDKFASAVGIKESKFIEYVYDRSIEVSLAENFWLQTEEEIEAYEKDENVLVDTVEFDRRVKEFFGSNQDFATLYLDYYHSDRSTTDDLFPDEMLTYIWFEAEWAEVVVAALDDLPVVQ